MSLQEFRRTEIYVFQDDICGLNNRKHICTENEKTQKCVKI